MIYYYILSDVRIEIESDIQGLIDGFELKLTTRLPSFYDTKHCIRIYKAETLKSQIETADIIQTETQEKLFNGNEFLHVDMAYRFTIYVDFSTLTVQYQLQNKGNAFALGSYLLHYVYMLMSRFGYITLHASAYKYNDNIIIYIGNSGGGKTTSGVIAIQYGYQLVTDDRLLMRFNDNKKKFEFIPINSKMGVSDFLLQKYKYMFIDNGIMVDNEKKYISILSQYITDRPFLTDELCVLIGIKSNKTTICKTSKSLMFRMIIKNNYDSFRFQWPLYSETIFELLNRASLNVFNNNYSEESLRLIESYIKQQKVISNFVDKKDDSV